MRMRLVLMLVLPALGVALAQNVDNAHTRKLADIRKLMELTGGDKVADQMFDAISANMRTTGGASGAGAEKFLQEFKKEVDFKQVIEIVVASYDQHLSAEDVKGLIGFYESPAGKHMLAAMPLINADMIAKIMPMSQAIAQKVMKRMQEENEK